MFCEFHGVEPKKAKRRPLGGGPGEPMFEGYWGAKRAMVLEKQTEEWRRSRNRLSSGFQAGKDSGFLHFRSGAGRFVRSISQIVHRGGTIHFPPLPSPTRGGRSRR